MSDRLRKFSVAMAASAVVISGASVPAMAATTKGGDPGVTTAGTCTGGATWKLSAKAREGGLEVEYEVDSNVVGQAWTYSVTRNGDVIASGDATTIAPSGSFSIETATTGTLTDTLAATATGAGQSCPGTPAAGTPAGNDDPAGDDNGTDPANHDVGDDHGTDPANHDAGDDHGATSGHDSAEDVADDHGRGEAIDDSCAAGAQLTVATKRQAGKVKVTVEVDGRRSGQDWRVKILRNGKVVHKSTERTHGHRDAFKVHESLRRARSIDDVSAVAKRASGSRTCSSLVHL